MKHYELDLTKTVSNDNWLVASRLLEEGSKESLEEFEVMDTTGMMPLSEYMLDYQIYDSIGIVGPFATTAELKYFREYVFRLDQYVALKEFLEEGASLITQELTDDIFMLESSDKAIKKILNILKKLMDEADMVMIIGDGS